MPMSSLSRNSTGPTLKDLPARLRTSPLHLDMLISTPPRSRESSTPGYAQDLSAATRSARRLISGLLQEQPGRDGGAADDSLQGGHKPVQEGGALGVLQGPLPEDDRVLTLGYQHDPGIRVSQEELRGDRGVRRLGRTTEGVKGEAGLAKHSCVNQKRHCLCAPDESHGLPSRKI